MDFPSDFQSLGGFTHQTDQTNFASGVVGFRAVFSGAKRAFHLFGSSINRFEFGRIDIERIELVIFQLVLVRWILITSLRKKNKEHQFQTIQLH